MSCHLPVLLKEAVDILLSAGPGRMLDGTFGGGGHSRALLEADAEISVLALDCDPAAAPRAEVLREEFPERFTFRAMNFGDLRTLEERGLAGALFDFGVSSFQLDEAERGFSFRQDAPLDLRMNPELGQSAYEFLENASRADLVRAVRDYGEEPRWHRVVEAIINARGTGVLARTVSFAELLAGVAASPSRIHPATKTFQGVRIAVNDELGVIERGLPEAFDRLRPGGVLAAISFHSLEDRLVKRLFNRLAGRPEHGRDNRYQDERVKQAELITRKPVYPGTEEVALNPRSRSARLRALRKDFTSPALATP